MVSSIPQSSLFAVPYVRWAQIALQRADWSLARRRIYDHQFVYVIEGRVAVTVGERKIIVTDHHHLLLQPQVPHHFQGLGDKAHHMIGIHFDWSLHPDTMSFPAFRAVEEDCDDTLFREPQSVPGWDLETAPALALKGRPRVLQLLQDVVASLSPDDAYSRLQAGGFLLAAIAQMAHEVALLRSVEANTGLGADAVRRVHRARELLESSVAQPLSVGEVAAAVGWSADHLGKMCRAVLNVSPYRLQTQARLRRAMELLRYGEVPMAEVAKRCGFNDASKFSAAFKRETGLTPRDFVRSQSNPAKRPAD